MLVLLESDALFDAFVETLGLQNRPMWARLLKERLWARLLKERLEKLRARQ